MLLPSFRYSKLLWVICLLACKKTEDPPDQPLFKDPVFVQMPNDFPTEVSGIAESYARTGSFWMIEDSNNGAQLLNVSDDGNVSASIPLPATSNRDWEDLAIGPGPEAGKKYLYVADIGDNGVRYENYSIYRVEEPAAGLNEISEVNNIRFTYSDGRSHNAEAILLDPATRNIIVVTKEQPSQIYELQYPYSTTTVNVAEKKGTTQLDIVTGGAASASGNELLLRTYQGIYYWKLQSGESVSKALTRAPLSIPAALEPQGEAIAFKKDGAGFYTISEKADLPISPRLYYYERN